MGNRRFDLLWLVSPACALAACTHDFGVFQPIQGASTGDAGTSDAAQVDGATRDAASDSPSTGCTEPSAIVVAGHCYFPTSRQSWDGVRTACAGAGAHLVTLGSAAEQTAVQAIDSSQERWIGLSRPRGSPTTDASYAWVDGEPRAYVNWEPGEPNGSGECARLRTSGQWADNTCTSSLVGICERE